MQMCIYIYIYISLSLHIHMVTPPPMIQPSLLVNFLSTVGLQYYVSKCFLRSQSTIDICEGFYTSNILTSAYCALFWYM